MESRPLGVTATDAVAIVISISMLASLVVPALAATDAAAGKTQCLMKMKAIAAAMQASHDTRRYLPLASTQPIINRPGSALPDAPAGASWLLQLCPFTDQADFYDRMFQATQRLKSPLFTPELVISHNKERIFPATYRAPEVICPSVPEVAVSSSDYPGVKAAVGSYCATSGTHFYNRTGVGRLIERVQGARGFAYEGNGAMPFPGVIGGRVNPKGRNYAAIRDGLSRTLAFGESRETKTAAWVDGQAMWVVATWPDSKSQPVIDTKRDSSGWKPPTLKWGPPTPTAESLSLRWEADAENPSPYLLAGRWAGNDPREWALSSYHHRAIGHAFCDGRAAMLIDDIDPEIYLQLVTLVGSDELDAPHDKFLSLIP
jgi:hypothetical protein